MLLYACTIFTSAFLLFMVQPIMAKQILPWFGGSSAVWTTCLVFFQFVLLFGYAYSDWTTRRLRPQAQAYLHIGLLCLSLVFLPIQPSVTWKPSGGDDPIWRILGLLLFTIGLPYFLLSTTGPLVQAWYVRRFQGAVPYRLFALSNLASMLALLSYPLAVETQTGVRVQTIGWSVGFALFVVLCSATAYITMKRGVTTVETPTEAAAEPLEDVPPTLAQRLAWLVFAGMGSFLLLAVTNHLCQNIASIPFLWVLPLSLYLITFILCFDGRGWYRRNLFLVLMAISLASMGYVIKNFDATLKLSVSIPVFSVGLFVYCMFCHGELTLMKPAPRYLTQFYLMISLGGALGALCVGVVAPYVLPAYFELQFGMIVLGLMGIYQARRLPVWAPLAGCAVVAFTAWAVGKQMYVFAQETRVMERDFYGVLRVWDNGPENEADTQRRIYHGSILHGSQLIFSPKRYQPTTYYGAKSGVGLALQALEGQGRRIGVVGLGAGSLAAYGKPGDYFRFYEIDPPVITLARKEFTYLNDSKARIETVLGDARLNLEREQANNFDLLVVDAFSGDSIPVHLLTAEAIRVYQRHLKPGGVLAFHISNHFLDLAPVVERLAAQAGMRAWGIYDEAEDDPDDILAASDWVLVTNNERFLKLPTIAKAGQMIPARKDLRVWTDDYNNLVQILK